MPVMPQDTSASNLSGAVQSKTKDVKESSSKTLASANDHKAPGPVMNQDLGEPASKEELKKRAAELNKE